MENVELDKQLQSAAAKEYEHNIVLNAGISRREATARIHHSSAVLFREINFEALSEHTQSLQPIVTRKAYLNLLKDYSPVAPDSLDLEEPPLNMNRAMEFAEGMCAKIVDIIRANKSKKTKKEGGERQG